MSLAETALETGLALAEALLQHAGSEEEARKLLTAAGARRGRAAADALELALYDEKGNPR
jgi:hypothetical protein